MRNKVVGSAGYTNLETTLVSLALDYKARQAPEQVQHLFVAGALLGWGRPTARLLFPAGEGG